MKQIATIITVIACGLMYYFYQNTQVPHDTAEWLDADQIPVTTQCEADTKQAKASTSCDVSPSNIDDETSP